ncbi:MAG: hypothetical protein AAGH15_12495, partial [Myxococcota bacterium]
MSGRGLSRAGALAAFAFVALATAPAAALPSFGSPSYTGSYRTCQTCHMTTAGGGTGCGSLTSPCLNPFGIRYRSAGWNSTTRSLDSDGDGRSNLGEIVNNYPGFPDNVWRPSGTGSTGVCNPVTCGATTSYTSCGSSRVNCRRSGLSSGGYSLQYNCDGGFGPFNASFSSSTNACPPINECATGNRCLQSGTPNTCSERSSGYWNCSCSATAGYRLQYNNVWTGLFTERCQEIPECAEGNPCLEDTTANSCIDFRTGGYICSCAGGFRRTNIGDYVGTIRETCTEIDECAEGNPCNEQVVGNSCSDSPFGRYTCTCGSGFLRENAGTLSETCADRPDCALDGSLCLQGFAGNSCADDELGRYNCTCGAGFLLVNN